MEYSKEQKEYMRDCILRAIQDWYDIGEYEENSRMMNQAFDMLQQLGITNYHLL
jgi:hypothetical protein